jgi:ubiquinone/menaquinone biosynthesis C-methylase UbiE
VPWYSFDPIAASYDETRTLDRRAIDAALGELAREFPPARFPRVLDVGIGTGRLAFPFARQGFRVVGIDISTGMLDRFRRHRARRSSGRVDAVRADATRMPFGEGTFDMAYWVHVLHLIPAWRRALDEALRVTRPGGVLVYPRTEGGRDIEVLDREYVRILRSLGFRRPRVGARRRSTTLAYLESQGCKVERRAARWEWVERVSVREALHYHDIRTYSMTRFAPLGAHREAMKRLRRWAAEELGRPDRRYRVVGAVSFDLARIPR